MSDNYIFNNLENNYNLQQYNILDQISPNPGCFNIPFNQYSQKPPFINNKNNNFLNQNFLINNNISDKIYNCQLKNFIKITCPSCSEFCSYKKSNYQLHINCKCGYENNSTLIEYSNTHNNNIENKECMSCSKNIDISNCYYCISCKIDICTECKNNHYQTFDDEHQLIPFAEKNFSCLEHGEKYTSYCYSCKQDICPQCISRHNELGHKIKELNIDVRKIDQELEELTNTFNGYKEVVNNLLNVLYARINMTEVSFKIYTEIINSHKKYRNQEALKNQRDFKMDFIKDFKNIINISKENNIIRTFLSIISLSNKISDIEPAISLYPKKNNLLIKKRVNIHQIQSIENIHIKSMYKNIESENYSQECIEVKNTKNESNSDINELFQVMKNVDEIKNSVSSISRDYNRPDNPNDNNILPEISVSSINNISLYNNIENNNINEPILPDPQIINNSNSLENQRNIINDSNNDNSEKHIDKSYIQFLEDNINELDIQSEYANLEGKYSNKKFFEDYENKIAPILNEISLNEKVLFHSQNEISDKPIERLSSIPVKSSSNKDYYQDKDSNPIKGVYSESSKESDIDFSKNIINLDPKIIKLVLINQSNEKISSQWDNFDEKIKSLKIYLSNFCNKFIESFVYYKNKYLDIFLEKLIEFRNNFIKSFTTFKNYLIENNIYLPLVHKSIIKKNEYLLGTTTNLIKRKKSSFLSNDIKLDKWHSLINIKLNLTKRKYDFDNFINSIVCYNITKKDSGLISINQEGKKFHFRIILSHYGNKIVCIAFLFDCVILLYRKNNENYLIFYFPFGCLFANIVHRFLCRIMNNFFHLKKINK